MGVAGHHDAAVRGRDLDERDLEVVKARDDVGDRRLRPEANVRDDLVVAGAGGGEAASGRPDNVREAGLDVHMDVFELLVPGKLSRSDLALDLFQTFDD